MSWKLVKDGKHCKCWLNLDEIEIYTEGINKGRRNWKNSIGKKFGARYKWCHDEIDEKWFVIKDCVNNYLTLVDKNNNEFKIHRAILCEGELGRIFNKKTNNFKYGAGDEINGLKIINREYRKNKKNENVKWYQYQCEKCGNIDWMCEGNLKKGTWCNVCCLNRKKVIEGVNDIATTHPHLCPYFVDQEDVYKYTAGSGEKVLLKCPDCGHQKEMTIKTLYRYGFGCGKCGNGISYPEKFMANILSQLNIKFITQLNHSTFTWCDKYSYDFYLPDCNIIIETHGEQHYEDGRGFFKTHEEEHENDLLKYDLAVLNGFECNKNYFVIDSRKSTLEWMKKNIIETLGHVFDLSNIDWQKADLESQKSHMLLACQLKKENPNLSTKEIVELIKKEIGIEYNRLTISNWLNRGNKLGLCHYDGKEEKTKSCKKRSGKNSPRARKVVSVDPLTKQPVFTWQYVKQATEFFSISRGALKYYLKGKSKTGHLYNGFLWYYLDDWQQLTK